MTKESNKRVSPPPPIFIPILIGFFYPFSVTYFVCVFFNRLLFLTFFSSFCSRLPTSRPVYRPLGHRYNIIFHWSKCCLIAEGGDMEGARQLLVEELDTLSAMRGWTVTVSPPPCLWSSHIRKRNNSLALSSTSKTVGTRCRSPSYERFLEGCSSPFIRRAEHLTALRAWCKQCLPAW